MAKLTMHQLGRRDFVDSTIAELLMALTSKGSWSVEDIASVRQVIFQVVHARTRIPEMEFYPFTWED